MCEGFELAYALFSVESRLKLGIIITGIDVAVGLPVDVAGRLVAVGREDLGIIIHAGQLPGHFRVSGPDYDILYEVRLLSRGRFSLYMPL